LGHIVFPGYSEIRIYLPEFLLVQEYCL
jgi:hypothetical protein